MTLVVNLYAGPGSGKSTLAAGLFYKLKTAGISCEAVWEFAKELCWEGTLKHTPQKVIFKEQSKRLLRLKDKVDVIVTDSPIMLGVAYMKPTETDLIVASLRVYRQFDNQNVFVRRVKPFSQRGRDQDEVQSKALDAKIKALLIEHDIPFKIVDGDWLGLEEIRGETEWYLKHADGRALRSA